MTSFTDISIYPKSTIPRLPFGRYVLKMIANKHPSGHWVHNCPELWGISSFGGQNLSFWKVKITSMRKDNDHSRPIIVAAQVWYKKGQWRKVIRFSCKSWWFGGCLNASWRSVLEFEQTTAQITNNIIKRYWYTTTAWEGYQTASCGIS
jgi:hypothetical protein